MKKTEGLIINIESSSSSVEKHYHLDWFELSIWTSFAGVKFFLSEIKNYLFSTYGCTLQEKYGNQRYHDSLRDEDYGVTIFHNVRNKVLNPPLSLCFTGRFFRYANHKDVIDRVLSILNTGHYVDPFLEGRKEQVTFRYQPVRIDASVDFISFGPVYKPIPHFLEISGCHGDFDYQFSGPDLDGLTLKMISSGSDGARLTVYDKLKDKHDKEYLCRHPEFDGCSGVWRLEFQFRRSEIKAVYKKSPFSFLNYESCYQEILGQCFRRYRFDGFVCKPSEVSCYLKRAKSTDESLLSWHVRDWIRKGHKIKQLERLVYPGLNKRPDYQKTEEELKFAEDMDFYDNYEQKEESPF